MLGVYKRAYAAFFLGFGEDMERQSVLSALFRPKNLNNTSARKAADAQCVVKAD